MQLLITSGWKDYKLIDSGNGARLEKFGEFKIIRPDPQIIWKPNLSKSEWQTADFEFERTHADKGKWLNKRHNVEQWKMNFDSLTFLCKLTPFKHTGVFPEQSLHWEWMRKMIKEAHRDINVLNLFGYTGIATLAAASESAKVTHVDASYPAIGWARENQKLSKLESKPIRWILDDAIKFVQREIKRGVKYDAIIMDPPVFGHGPNGETWEFNKSFPQLLELCTQVLSSNPLFVLVNAYAVSTSAVTLGNVFEDNFSKLAGQIEYGELVIEELERSRLLSTGIYAKWYKKSN